MRQRRPFLGYEDTIYNDSLFLDLIFAYRLLSETGDKDREKSLYSVIKDVADDPDQYGLTPEQQFCLPRPYRLDHIEAIPEGDDAGVYVYDRGDEDGVCGICDRGGAIRPASAMPSDYYDRVHEYLVESGLFERLEVEGYYI
jgi:hypothetical protein